MIGIYTPYNHGEATAMAVSLAELSWELGIEAGLLADGRRESVVHPAWDDRVQAEHKTDVQEWLNRCSHVVWLSPHAQRMARARRLRRKNIVLALWHNLRLSDHETLREADVVVCPSHACYRWLKDEWNLHNLEHVEWSIPKVIRRRPLGTSRRVLFPITSRLKQLPKWIYALELTLDRLPGLQLTLLQNTPGNRQDNELLTELRRKQASRVQLIRIHNADERQQQYLQHDGLIWPTAMDHSSHFPLEAVHAGTPVISLNIPPHTHGLLPGLCSWLIDSDQQHSELGLPYADPKLSQLVDGLTAALGPQRPLEELHAADWQQLTDRQQAFGTFWRKTWDLI